ncbi:type II toxin-antitoxin system PemK/MazF family toxin [Oceanobacillus alkalisoli]|uniref:type II toxin-antitoxin system PemK/MazF family toxin n=1 Tax=Oceanobacillus alkalisoli TaxID=2925113 RepID=UPI0034D96BAA
MTNDIVVVAITSKVRNHEFSVSINTIDLSEGELKVTSEIRTDKIYTLSKQIVRTKIRSGKFRDSGSCPKAN